jgi:hypothetical protein
MLWKTAKDLQDKGWVYSFEGQMLEIVRIERVLSLLTKVLISWSSRERTV